MSDAKAGSSGALRILRVTPSLYHRGAHPVAFDPVGGLQTQVWRLAGALDAKGLAQTIWTGRLPGVPRRAQAFERTQVHCAGFGVPSFLACRCTNLAWFLGAIARRRRASPGEHDLLHLHYNHCICCRVLTLLLAGRGLPVVVSLSTELWVGTDPTRPLSRLAFGLARRIVLTPTGVPNGPSAPALPDGRVRIVPDAIDAERYARAPPTPDVARFRCRHGVPANPTRSRATGASSDPSCRPPRRPRPTSGRAADPHGLPIDLDPADRSSGSASATSYRRRTRPAAPAPPRRNSSPCDDILSPVRRHCTHGRRTRGRGRGILAAMEGEKRYRVELVNHGVTLDVGADEPIYRAALAAGIQLPIACDYGGCITCAARLRAGKVRQPNATALNRRQSRAGYILLCVARPKSDCVVEEGIESQGELHVNPFAMLPGS